MRIAVLSDIHSNLEALDAVLPHARDAGAAAVYVLGDIVGYGADPQAVVDRLGDLEAKTLIAGNHDLAVTGRFDLAWFNSAAEAAALWTTSVIRDDSRALLLSLQPRAETNGTLLVHGSVVDPAAEYVFNTSAAEESFDAGEFSLCFFGHTHMPTVFERAQDGAVRGRVLGDGEPISIDGSRFMLNPGSVGQPRDGDPRASYMVYDAVDRVATIHRVPYAVERAQEKIRAAGLPSVLADRLSVGR